MSIFGVEQFPSRTLNNFFLKSIFLSSMSASIKKTRTCASLGLRMKFKTLFMIDFDLLLFFNISKQFLAPGGLNAECHECVQVSVM